MPPRKEPKDKVVYPASKRKAPPFKPQRPAKVSRGSTNESESSRTLPAKPPPVKKHNVPKKVQVLEMEDQDEDDAADDSDEDLPEDPRAAPPPKKRGGAVSANRSTERRQQSVRSNSQFRSSSPPGELDRPPPLSQLDEPTQLPQPLLIRLLHEHFVDKSTKIDKHAVQVLQKYMEVFVREAIARTALLKREAAEKGEIDEEDAKWLELEDLEKVAPGMMVDF